MLLGLVELPSLSCSGDDDRRRPFLFNAASAREKLRKRKEVLEEEQPDLFGGLERDSAELQALMNGEEERLAPYESWHEKHVLRETPSVWGILKSVIRQALFPKGKRRTFETPA